MTQLDDLLRLGHRLGLDPDRADVARLLASPTLGAWQRANGVDGWCDYARVVFVLALTEEALRRAILDRLDPVLIGLSRNAAPEDIARRLWRLALEIDPSLACAGCAECDEAAA